MVIERTVADRPLLRGPAESEDGEEERAESQLEADHQSSRRQDYPRRALIRQRAPATARPRSRARADISRPSTLARE